MGLDQTDRQNLSEKRERETQRDSHSARGTIFFGQSYELGRGQTNICGVAYNETATNSREKKRKTAQ